MMEIQFLPASAVVQAVGWALLHFVWQGAAIALLTAAVLRLLRAEAPQVRYVIACCAMAGMLAVPVLTGIAVYTSGSTQGHERVGAGTTLGASQPGLPLSAPQSGGEVETAMRWLGLPGGWFPAGPSGAEVLLSWLVAVWLAGVLVLSMRGLGGWHLVRKLRRGGVPVEAAWQRRLDELGRRLGITQSVQLLQAGAVRVPMVIGWARPAILLPASALTGLTPQQLEAILLHELAHIRRHDYLVNLFQVVIETLLFFNPAVWWVSNRIREEREHCCDDVAASLSGGALFYTYALVELEELRHLPPRLAMAVSGGSLLRRVQRLLAPARPAPASTLWVAGLLVSVILGSGAGLYAYRPGAPVPETLRAAAPALAAAESAQPPLAGGVPREASDGSLPLPDVAADASAAPAAPAGEGLPTPFSPDPSATVLVVIEAGESGIPRTASIVDALAPHRVTAVYTTSDRRTLDVARPLADWLGVARISYDLDRDPDRFGRTLLGSGGIERVPGALAVIVVPRIVIPGLLRQASGTEVAEAELQRNEVFVIRGQGRASVTRVAL